MSKNERNTMKLKSIILFTLLVTTSLFAQNKGFGIGIIVGEPTGVSLKTFTGSSTAFDAAAAWSLTDNGGFHIHADYLFHDYSLINVRSGRLPFYYGFGARVKLLDKDKTGDDLRLGARVPVGLSYEFATFPGDLFFEIVPILDLIPDTDFSFNAAIGFRYYL